MKGFTSKLKAGALQFSILISVVIAVIIAAFILLTHIQQKFSQKIQFSTSAVHLSNSGITYSRNYPITYGDSIALDFENTNNQERVVISKTHWGLFDKIISLGESKSFQHKKIALVGGSVDSLNRSAIHLDNTNTPLVVAGSTRVIGKAIVPSQGVKAGTIKGNYYQGKRLIYGPISKTASGIPNIPKEKRTYIQELLFDPLVIDNQSMIAHGQKEVNHTFNESSQWIYSKGIIDLMDQKISNNVIIKSDTLIRVSAFAKAENIILIAPHIIFDNNAKVSVQAFASKSITLEENVQLAYPSALTLLEKNRTTEKATSKNQGILLKKGARVLGSVVHLSASNEYTKTPKISIEEGATVMGEVYSDEWLELFGTVNGSVYTRELAARVRGSVYKNHLFNATINASKLSIEYSGLMFENSSKKVIQWVF